VTLREPALNILVTKNGVALSTARVRITPMSAGCGTVFGAAGLLTAQGQLINPGLPYGDYQVCADDGTRKVVSATIQDRAPGGTATVPLAIPTTGAAGTCP
jgi:hypothetical protein